ncbi:MAG: amidohydrolase family protein [Armatimonadota bacterium]
MPYDLVIHRAQLRQRGGLVDIGIADGKIAVIEARLEPGAHDEIDAAGRLVTEPFVDCHFHIDKSFLGAATGRFDYPLGGHHDGIPPLERHRALKAEYTIEGVAERMGRALELALIHGTLAVRMFVDVDPVQGLTALNAALVARKRFADRMTLQICAFPQEGTLGNPETLALMEQAMDLGADVVGGIPWVEANDAAVQLHVDHCFSLARRFGRQIHMLCDDTPSPSSRTLEMVAARTIREGFYGRVCSSHNGALRFYPDADASKVIDLVRQAGIHAVVIPTVNLLGALTRIEELLAAGVNVCAGQDDLDNFFYPLGCADMLDSMNFIVHLAHLATPRGFETAFDIVTRNGARALGLTGFGVEVGADANLLIFEGKNLHEVLQMHAARSFVIARGRVAAITTRAQHVAPVRTS